MNTTGASCLLLAIILFLRPPSPLPAHLIYPSTPVATSTATGPGQLPASGSPATGYSKGCQRPSGRPGGPPSACLPRPGSARAPWRRNWSWTPAGGSGPSTWWSPTTSAAAERAGTRRSLCCRSRSSCGRPCSRTGGRCPGGPSMAASLCGGSYIHQSTTNPGPQQVLDFIICAHDGRKGGRLRIHWTEMAALVSEWIGLVDGV